MELAVIIAQKTFSFFVQIATHNSLHREGEIKGKWNKVMEALQ